MTSVDWNEDCGLFKTELTRRASISGGRYAPHLPCHHDFVHPHPPSFARISVTLPLPVDFCASVLLYTFPALPSLVCAYAKRLAYSTVSPPPYVRVAVAPTLTLLPTLLHVHAPRAVSTYALRRTHSLCSACSYSVSPWSGSAGSIVLALVSGSVDVCRGTTNTYWHCYIFSCPCPCPCLRPSPCRSLSESLSLNLRLVSSPLLSLSPLSQQPEVHILPPPPHLLPHDAYVRMRQQRTREFRVIADTEHRNTRLSSEQRWERPHRTPDRASSVQR